MYRLDPRYHYALAPGTRKLYRNSEPNGGRRVLFVVNRDGFRGDELRDGPGPRVVVYGDSFVEADYTPLPETFAKRLEARLASALGRRRRGRQRGGERLRPRPGAAPFRGRGREAAPRGGGPGGVRGQRLRRRAPQPPLPPRGRPPRRGRRLRGGEPVVAVRGRPAADALPPAEGPAEAPQRAPTRGRFRRGSREARETTSPARWRCARTSTGRIVLQGERAVDDVFRDPYDADVALSPGSPAAAYKRDLLEAVLGRWRQAADGGPGAGPRGRRPPGDRLRRIRRQGRPGGLPAVRPDPPQPHRGRRGPAAGPARPRAYSSPSGRQAPTGSTSATTTTTGTRAARTSRPARRRAPPRRWRLGLARSGCVSPTTGSAGTRGRPAATYGQTWATRSTWLLSASRVGGWRARWPLVAGVVDALVRLGQERLRDLAVRRVADHLVHRRAPPSAGSPRRGRSFSIAFLRRSSHPPRPRPGAATTRVHRLIVRLPVIARTGG